MKAIKLFTFLFALAASGGVWAKPTDVKVAASGKITVASKGKDVRDVLFDLFSQSKRSFVLDPGVKFDLYLNLCDMTFDDALDVVLTAADLGYDVKDKIYYVAKGKSRPPKTKAIEAKKNVIVPAPAPQVPRAIPKPRLSDHDLQKHLTTRLSMTDIRSVFGEFARQTGFTITIAEDVPHYKVDAFLIDTSLKYAMDSIVEAAGLKYTRTDTGGLLVEVVKKG